MNIYFRDISCKSCTPENYIKANDYILKLELFCEIATRYPRAFIVILAIIISLFLAVGV